jgi:hypothetical protein
VYVDGTPYDMVHHSGSMEAGAVFRAQTALPKGRHEYFFVFNDGQTSNAYPIAKSLVGPSVG